jgi:asparagine synthase (glutamine-hydrolysing)
MCGFAGVIAWDERFHIDRDALTRMSGRIAHRGPDGHGLVLLPSPGDATDSPTHAALAHRRLAILDPDPRANQPFTDGAGRWIVFNGEIYNFRELRAEISSTQQGYRWRTDCDTEVLLAAYGLWGDKCTDRLNGMFAVAVWDAPAGRLFLARDRMGQKPLYFAVATGAGRGATAVAFASELPAVLEVPWVARAVDPTKVIEYLRFGYIVSGSVYHGIQAVAPSTSLAFGPDGTFPALRTYFQPNATAAPDKLDIHERPAQTTRRLVLQAVSRQLVSDVPLGCFLSGGVDSSVIAAAMRAAVPTGQAVMTFTIGFDDAGYDETAYAAAVARHLGTEHQSFMVRIDAADELPRLAAAFGEPFGDSSALPTHYLSRETRAFVKVALSGDGGDELFGGYDRYRAMRLASRIDALPGIRKVLASRRWQSLPGFHPRGRLTRLKRFLAPMGESPSRRYARYTALVDDAALAELLRPDFAVPATAKLSEAFDALRAGNAHDGAGPRDDVQAALALDRITYLPGDLLTKVDRCSMLHALEVRSPFMDPQILRFASGLATEQLLGGGPKRLLREAFAGDLPAAVFKRRKMGFAVPIGDWFRDRSNRLRGLLRDTLLAADSFAAAHFQRPAIEKLIKSHEDSSADHSQRLYALLMLELWWKARE